MLQESFQCGTVACEHSFIGAVRHRSTFGPLQLSGRRLELDLNHNTEN